MSAGRFSAVLQVFEVPAPEPTTSARGFVPASAPEPVRRPDPVEVAKVIIRADTLDDLKDKITAHTGLI